VSNDRVPLGPEDISPIHVCGSRAHALSHGQSRCTTLVSGRSKSKVAVEIHPVQMGGLTFTESLDGSNHRRISPLSRNLSRNTLDSVPMLGSHIGACVGACMGAFVIELSGGRDFRASLRAGFGAGMGRAVGTVIKLAFGILLWLIISYRGVRTLRGLSRSSRKRLRFEAPVADFQLR
jgi:uncharacterized protein DUF456